MAMLEGVHNEGFFLLFWESLEAQHQIVQKHV